MSKMKKCKVVMLPTNEKAEDCLLLSSNSKDIFYKKGYFTQSYLTEIGRTAQHLYILSEDEIKEGDWCILLDDYGTVMSNAQQYNDPSKQVLNNGLRKIIATTNTSLTVKTERAGDNSWHNPLPQPSIQFIQKYTEEYNKGNIIKDVLVEYEWIDNPEQIPGVGDYWDLKIHPKDNTITIKKVKDSWNREEVIKLLIDLNSQIDKTSGGLALGESGLNKWIEHNL